MASIKPADTQVIPFTHSSIAPVHIMASLHSLTGPTLGAIELGVLCALILYGIMLVQVYNYYQLKFKDSMFIKLSVRAQQVTFYDFITSLTIFFSCIPFCMPSVVTSHYKYLLKADSFCTPQDHRDRSYHLHLHFHLPCYDRPLWRLRQSARGFVAPLLFGPIGHHYQLPRTSK